MSGFRFASLPSHDSVATGVTLAVSAWLTLAAGAILADRGEPRPADEPQRAVLMEEALPASPTPLPVAAVAGDAVHAEARPEVCETIVVQAGRIRA
jgi:hypothetical protein